MSTEVVDPDRLKAFSFLLFSKLEGAVTAAMVYLGHHLGLYQALAASDEPVTSAVLASRTGLAERWVREWLHNQAAAHLVDSTDGERFGLTAEARAVLATPSHPAYGLGPFQRLPVTMSMLNVLPDSFRSGIGYNYDAQGPEGAAGIEQGFAPWFRNYLVPVCLPALDGVVPKLERGAVVADVGCGAGVAVLTIAEAFPASQVHGYDISQFALERAAQNKARAGLANAHFHDARAERLPDDGSVDLITTFDCIHDMTHPAEVVAAIRRALSADGTWLLVDIKARESFVDNVEKNPMASMMYGISVLSCLSSSLSEAGGAGLGTLGLTPSKAEGIARSSGFTRFRRLAVEHPINAFYEIRP